MGVFDRTAAQILSVLQDGIWMPASSLSGQGRTVLQSHAHTIVVETTDPQTENKTRRGTEESFMLQDTAP